MLTASPNKRAKVIGVIIALLIALSLWAVLLGVVYLLL